MKSLFRRKSARSGLLRNSCEVSKEAVAQFFRWNSIQSSQTILRGVEMLRPGELIEGSPGDYKRRIYCLPSWHGNVVGDATQGEREVKDAIEKSVRAHLISDVPVGVFLSGGLDSTIIVAAMKAADVNEINAFSVKFDDGGDVEDESSAAERTAEFYGAEFHRETVTSAGLLESMSGFIGYLDQPSGEALNAYLVSRAASKYVKVALSGTGADELFAGYRYLQLIKMSRLVLNGRMIPSNLRERLLCWRDSCKPTLRSKQWFKLLEYCLGVAGVTAREMYLHARTVAFESEVLNFVGNVVDADELLPQDWWGEEEGIDDEDLSWLSRMLLLETRNYLPNSLLKDGDNMSMAHSLEVRLPFVDREVFKVAGNVADSQKLGYLQGKRVLREAFRASLPSWIYNDTLKKPFCIPLMKWLRRPEWQLYMEDTFRKNYAVEMGIVSRDTVATTLVEFNSSGVTSKRGHMHGQRLWNFLVLEAWLQARY